MSNVLFRSQVDSLQWLSILLSRTMHWLLRALSQNGLSTPLSSSALFNQSAPERAITPCCASNLNPLRYAASPVNLLLAKNLFKFKCCLYWFNCRKAHLATILCRWWWDQARMGHDRPACNTYIPVQYPAFLSTMDEGGSGVPSSTIL